MIRELRPAPPVERIVLTVSDRRFDLPDLVIARQPHTRQEAAQVAVAYAAEWSDAHQRATVARSAYRTLIAYDAAVLLGATPGPERTYGLGIADLHAVLAGQPTAIDRALRAI